MWILHWNACVTEKKTINPSTDKSINLHNWRETPFYGRLTINFKNMQRLSNESEKSVFCVVSCAEMVLGYPFYRNG